MSRIKAISRHKIETQRLFNLAVEKDESFIANGIVVHNCRSVLIPVTIFEKDFEPDKKAGGTIEIRDPKDRTKYIEKTIPKQDIDKFIEENIGAGFSKR